MPDEDHHDSAEWRAYRRGIRIEAMVIVAVALLILAVAMTA